MRYLMFVVMLLVALWSVEGYTLNSPQEGQMSFRIQSLGARGYEYSSLWNPLTQVALLRIGLVLSKADVELINQSISFGTASEVLFESNDSQSNQSCQQVSQWHFEYEPGLPNYLMYVALKGPGCARVAKYFDNLQVKLRFRGISLPQFVPIDVSVNISR
ncbi:hypothetical protein EZJ49_03510 [Bdellovibrio bacteriovorus]|uniref:hypothetical protein n=1 Tax=Bdellovibrio bacteriovorus TaxID=959 RepID=UPI0021CECE5E|nr:hypothetical protein [Bdellovibrio bacteriovorus]UXR65317.1 hypothetical protein EZJ49_03510 [Bdellovibrio bacteriovorus]